MAANRENKNEPMVSGRDETANRRFVVLFHSHPVEDDHYDLMIDSDEGLLTWRVPIQPESISTQIEIVRLSIHRRDYLDYEGPVSKNRGHVTRYDTGRCIVLSESAESLAIEFEGKKLVGHVDLRQSTNDKSIWIFSRA